MFALPDAEAPSIPAPQLDSVDAGDGAMPLHVFAAAADFAVSRTARRYQLTTLESEELRSDLWLKWLEDRRGLRNRLVAVDHPGRYLTRVARNLLLDGYIARFGKRRPTRSGHRIPVVSDRSVAATSFRRREPTTLRAEEDVVEGRSLRSYVGESVLLRLACRNASPFDERRRSVARRDGRQLRCALRNALKCLPDRHRELLIERYIQRRTVADIAAARNVRAKGLYREYASVFARLRQLLRRAGFDHARVSEVLEQHGLEFELGFA